MMEPDAVYVVSREGGLLRKSIRTPSFRHTSTAR